MPWRRSRRSLRFIVGDQHNSTSTTRELGFGPRKHGALTGLAKRASQPSGGSLTSNREASPPSPRPRWTVKPPLADDKAWLGMTHLVLKQPKTRPTPGKITDLAAPPQHGSGDPHPRLDTPPGSLGGSMRFHRRGIYAHAAPHSLVSISRASTPLRALSTRKRPNRGKWTSKTNQACANCPRTTLTRGQ